MAEKMMSPFLSTLTQFLLGHKNAAKVWTIASFMAIYAMKKMFTWQSLDVLTLTISRFYYILNKWLLKLKAFVVVV